MKYILVLLAFSFLLSVSPVFAGGGRMSLSSDHIETVVGLQKKVTATIGVQAYNAGQGERPSENEHIEFKIDSPRAGDVCVTVQGTTDSSGHATATCTATTPGTFLVYARSLDKGDESGRLVLTFVAKPAMKKTTPTITTSKITPSLTPSPTLSQDVVLKSQIVKVTSSRPLSLWERILKFFHF